jgi:hypothetical protein
MVKNKSGLANTPKPLDLDLRPGQSIELLKELHILTRDGKINQDSRRKLKQVYHLYQFIEKLLQELPATEAGPTLADHGAGKSYLGFILYDLFFKSLGKGEIYGIETRGELVAASHALRSSGLPLLQLYDIMCPTDEQDAEARLIHLVDNQAMLAAVRTGRNPTMRHLTRVHVVCLGFLHEQFSDKSIAMS